MGQKELEARILRVLKSGGTPTWRLREILFGEYETARTTDGRHLRRVLQRLRREGRIKYEGHVWKTSRQRRCPTCKGSGWVASGK